MRKIPQNFTLGGQLDMSYWLELPNLHFLHQQIWKMPQRKSSDKTVLTSSEKEPPLLVPNNGFLFCVKTLWARLTQQLEEVCSWNEIWLQWEKDWKESEKCLRGGEDTCRSVTKRDRTPDFVSSGPLQDKMLKWWCDVTVTSFYWQFLTDPSPIIVYPFHWLADLLFTHSLMLLRLELCDFGLWGRLLRVSRWSY